MEEDRLTLVKQILSSQQFRNQTKEQQRATIDQITSTGEISKEEVEELYNRFNASQLEKLPYDVFVNLVQTSEMTGKDLIHLCASSPILNEYCNRPIILPNGDEINQYLFRILLQNRYGIDAGANPREEYQRIAVGDGLKFRKLKELLEYTGSNFAQIPVKFRSPSILYDLFSRLDIIRILERESMHHTDIFTGKIVYNYGPTRNHDLEGEIRTWRYFIKDIEKLVKDTNEILVFNKTKPKITLRIKDLLLSKDEFKQLKGLELRDIMIIAKNYHEIFIQNETRSLGSTYLDMKGPSLLDLSLNELMQILDSFNNLYAKVLFYEAYLFPPGLLKQKIKERINSLLRHKLRELKFLLEEHVDPIERQSDHIVLEELRSKIVSLVRYVDSEQFEPILDYILNLFNKVINGKLNLNTPFTEENLS